MTKIALLFLLNNKKYFFYKRSKIQSIKQDLTATAAAAMQEAIAPGSLSEIVQASSASGGAMYFRKKNF